MGQSQGKGLYSQVGAGQEDIDKPDSFVDAVRTQGQQAIIRAKVIMGKDIDLDNNEADTGDQVFVFHNNEGDTNDRVVHDRDIEIKRGLNDELAWRIFQEIPNSKERILLLLRMSFDRWYKPEEFSSTTFRTGNIVEYLVNKELKWAIWNRDDIIFWDSGIIYKKTHRDFPYPCRKVPTILSPTVTELSPTEIIINSTSEDSNLSFSNSQCWAAWSVTGNKFFSAIPSKEKFFLELPDLGITERFSSLDELMTHKVEYETMGCEAVQKHFGVKQNLRGMVPCIQ